MRTLVAVCLAVAAWGFQLDGQQAAGTGQSAAACGSSQRRRSVGPCAERDDVPQHRAVPHVGLGY